MISRAKEYDAYEWILKAQRKLGSKWFKSWKTTYNPEKPFFDAANLLRIGLDIIFQLSVSGNENGYRFFREFMEKRYNGKVRVHPVRDVYDGYHIDSTFVALGYNKLIGKNILLANPERCDPTNIPVIFRGKNWVVLNSADMIDQGYEEGFLLSSKWIGQNIFSINPNLVLIDEAQKPLINLLKFYGIDSLAVPNEVGRTVGGGFHCMTNDYRREEEIDFEKILKKNTKELTTNEEAGYFDPELLKFLKSQGDINNWVEIANSNGIFPTYLTEHLGKKAKEELNSYHNSKISALRSKKIDFKL